MAKSIYIPKLGVEMTSAILVEWVVPEGAQVEAGQIIANLETDKLTKEMEAPAAGYLYRTGEEGVEYPVTASIGQVAASKDEYDTLAGVAAAPSVAAPTAGSASVAAPVVAANGRIKASPLAKRIAKDNSIALSAVQGTGHNGAIIRRDVLAAIESGATAVPAAEPVAVSPAAFATEPGQYHELPYKTIKRVETLRGMPKALVDNMFKSMQTTAQMTGFSEVEVSGLIAFRKDMVALSETLGYRLTYTDILIKAAACALKEAPLVNTSLYGHDLVYWENINIGVAVAMPGGGLVVPVIHNADKLGLGEIHRRLDEAVERAKNKALTYEDISGSTFTLTNYGSFGGHRGTPVLNLPEVAILGTGAIVQRPIVKDGAIVIGNMMDLSFTTDHRVISGEPSSRFMRTFIKCVEDPRMLLLR